MLMLSSQLQFHNTSKMAGENYGPVGYNFEPQFTDSQLQERSDTRSIRTLRAERQSRRLTLDWCRCGKCDIMRKEEECLCCREMPALVDIFRSSSETETVQCITFVPDFHPVCLNKAVLRASYAGMADMKHRGENVPAVPKKLENRFV